MKVKFLFTALAVLLSFSCFSQSKDKYVYVSSTLNLYPELESYSYFSEVEARQDNLLLNFLTRNSGTFILEELPDRIIDVENINKFPTQIFNIGASFRTEKRNSTFQEFSLNRLSGSKSSYVNNYTFQDSVGRTALFQIGYEQRSFIASIRYEYGKMFGSPKSRVRFGLSGVLEPSFYSYKRTSLSTREFSMKGSILSLHLALAPIVSFKLSRKVYLDLKIIPRFLVADFGNIQVNNPTLTLSQRGGEREYSLPELDIATTIQVRYMLKEPKKKTRRRSKD